MSNTWVSSWSSSFRWPSIISCCLCSFWQNCSGSWLSNFFQPDTSVSFHYHQVARVLGRVNAVAEQAPLGASAWFMLHLKEHKKWYSAQTRNKIAPWQHTIGNKVINNIQTSRQAFQLQLNTYSATMLYRTHIWLYHLVWSCSFTIQRIF